MRASVVMAIAVLAYIVTRWAHNKPALTVKSVVGGAFAVFVIAMLDQGRTEEIARGFAWLFLIVAAYGVIDPIAQAAAGKATGKVPAKTKAKVVGS
jgi:hypothetical protein